MGLPFVMFNMMSGTTINAADWVNILSRTGAITFSGENTIYEDDYPSVGDI